MESLKIIIFILILTGGVWTYDEKDMKDSSTSIEKLPPAKRDKRISFGFY